MSKDFQKVLHLAHATLVGNIFAKVSFKDGKLSITGVEGPMQNGDCRGSSGQIVMSYLDGSYPEGFKPAEGWTAEALTQFFAMWNRWHLNDIRAGSPVQEDYLRAHPVKAVYPQSHYELARKVLADAGLNPDPSGYNYGSAWVREEVPAEAIAYFQSLPDSHRVPAWI